MRAYRLLVRALFSVIFILGGISHFVLGRLTPEGYEVFGNTALFSWLSELWTVFVMPNIGWLTIALGIFEVLCGIGITQKRFLRLSVLGMTCFLMFVTVLGYGFPTHSAAEDILKNRIITIAMMMLLLPLLFPSSSSADRVSPEGRPR